MSHRLGLNIICSVFVLAMLPFAPLASGQCTGPDNLDAGSCCQQLDANLPQFPGAFLPGLGICWDQCLPSAQTKTRVEWQPPSQNRCAQYTTALKVLDSTSGATLLTGKMQLDYTRTWFEGGTAGTLTQVWRFVAKADLTSPPGTSLPPCPVPSCLPPAGPHQTAFYYGYVDYAIDCGTTTGYQNSIVLFHGCDFFQHKPGISSRPGSFHPTRSYAIVAPHSTVQPFVPAVMPLPGGPLVAEAMRNVTNTAGTSFCTTEDPVSGGTQSPLISACMCPLSLTPPQVTLSLYTGKGTCLDPIGLTSSWTSLFVGFPTIPWPHMVSTSIGTWTSPSVYPGDEAVWVNEGLFKYRDVCNANDYYEVFYGASTDLGFPVIPTTPVGLPVQKFTDVADNWSAPVSGPHPLPLLGNIMTTNHLIYTNVP